MPAILFVCTANQIRSPLAAHLFAHKLATRAVDPDRWRVESAGTWAAPGLPVLPVAQRAGAELGVDLSDHRSRSVENVDLAVYDRIITMEQGQRDALRAERPDLPRDRIVTLGEAATGFAFDVADPPGHTPAATQATARELDRLIEKIVSALAR